MNNDIKRRDTIIFGNYNPDRYFGGCARTDIPAKTLLKLYEEGFVNPDECQNESPTTQEFLCDISGIEDNVVFEIYAIDDKRDDYRVTIEGIQVGLPIDKRMLFLRLATKYGYADEFHIWEDDNENLRLRAWWD